MAFDFIATKKAARRALHETLAVSSIHTSSETGAVNRVRVRVHTRIALSGDVDYQGFAELSDGVVMIHVDSEEARRLKFAADDRIIYDNKVYQLSTQRDDDGIYLESWYAVHLEDERPFYNEVL